MANKALILEMVFYEEFESIPESLNVCLSYPMKLFVMEKGVESRSKGWDRNPERICCDIWEIER